MSQAHLTQSTPPRKLSEWFRSIIRGKTRIALAWIFAILLVAFTREYPNFLGTFVCFIGATFRFWASGYLRKDSNLAVGGPYRITRNPLYLGTYLMTLGVAMATFQWVLLAVSTLLFGIVYHYIILDEETKLQELFGTPYQNYQQLVPRFFPRLWPQQMDELKTVNTHTEHYSFSWRLAHQNKAYEAYVSFIGLIGFVSLVAYLWKE